MPARLCFPGPAPPLVSGMTFQTHHPAFLPHHLPSDYQGNNQCTESNCLPTCPSDPAFQCPEKHLVPALGLLLFQKCRHKEFDCKVLPSCLGPIGWDVASDCSRAQAQAWSFLKAGRLRAGTSRMVRETFELGQCRNLWDCEKELCHSSPSWREKSQDNRQGMKGFFKETHCLCSGDFLVTFWYPFIA